MEHELLKHFAYSMLPNLDKRMKNDEVLQWTIRCTSLSLWLKKKKLMKRVDVVLSFCANSTHHLDVHGND